MVSSVPFSAANQPTHSAYPFDKDGGGNPSGPITLDPAAQALVPSLQPSDAMRSGSALKTICKGFRESGDAGRAPRRGLTNARYLRIVYTSPSAGTRPRSNRAAAPAPASENSTCRRVGFIVGVCRRRKDVRRDNEARPGERASPALRRSLQRHPPRRQRRGSASPLALASLPLASEYLTYVCETASLAATDARRLAIVPRGQGYPCSYASVKRCIRVPVGVMVARGPQALLCIRPQVMLGVRSQTPGPRDLRRPHPYRGAVRDVGLHGDLARHRADQPDVRDLCRRTGIACP